VLDVEQLRKRLLDRTDRTYHGWADGEASDLLRQAREACDPRVVPVLVEVMDRVPESSSSRSYVFRETLTFYATICPRAMLKELEARQRTSTNPEELSDRIRSEVQHVGGETAVNPSFLRDEVKNCFRLAQRVRDGHDDVAALLQAVEQLVAKRELSFEVWQGLPALLDSHSPAAREQFVSHVQSLKRGEINRLSHQRYIGSALPILLHHIYPKHSGVYVEQVLELLKSESLMERKAGVESLKLTLQSDFDFDYQALEAERLRQMAAIEPLLARMAATTEGEARAILLSQRGFALEGKLGDGWLKTLHRAAASREQDAALNALRLIEMIVGEQRCRRLGGLTPPHRARAVAAYLHDAGKKWE
jgi:hypothetical protein